MFWSSKFSCSVWKRVISPKVLLAEHLLEMTASGKIEQAVASVLLHGWQPEEQSSAVSCRKTWACSPRHTGFCLLCHAAINPEQLHWNGGNCSRFMPDSVKRGFLLNGSGQPLARWKGKKWLSFRQLLLITGFCQAQSHRFPFLFFPFVFSLPPLIFFFCVSDCVLHRKEDLISEGRRDPVAGWTSLSPCCEQGTCGGADDPC